MNASKVVNFASNYSLNSNTAPFNNTFVVNHDNRLDIKELEKLIEDAKEAFGVETQDDEIDYFDYDLSNLFGNSEDIGSGDSLLQKYSNKEIEEGFRKVLVEGVINHLQGVKKVTEISKTCKQYIADAKNFVFSNLGKVIGKQEEERILKEQKLIDKCSEEVFAEGKKVIIIKEGRNAFFDTIFERQMKKENKSPLINAH